MTQFLPPDTRLVFDTNVLVSAFVYKKFAGEVYQHCAERYYLFTSAWILEELADKLTHKFKLPEPVQNDILAQVRADTRLVLPTNALPTDSSDPDDNYVLQAALFVDANVLITGDKEHLLPLRRIANTEIISPREFYERYIA